MDEGINSHEFQSAQVPEFKGIQQLIDSEIGLIKYSTELVRKFFNLMNLEKIMEQQGKLLEFGAGTGFLAELFKNNFNLAPDCVELDPKLISTIRKKGFSCYQFLSELPYKYDAIYTSNVLEHILDDTKTLRELYASLKPGGVMCIYVPAHPLLYATMDKEIGHVRRYTKNELKDKVVSSGFQVLTLYYDDVLGFFASLVVKLFGYKNNIGLGSRKSLSFYDKFIYPVSKILDLLGFRFILGKNLILIARKKA